MTLAPLNNNIKPYLGNNNYINEYNILASLINNCNHLHDCYLVGNKLRKFIKKYGTVNTYPLSDTLFETTYNLFKS